MTERGSSLIELIIAIVVLLIISAAIFQAVNAATGRSTTEQAKVDMFQEAREFMDQMSRDLRQAGYPNPRNVDAGDLWFEGDVTGDGTVSVVQYHLDTSTSNNCPCLKRSQLPKVTGNPLTGQTAASYQIEVQGVQNTDIFSARSNGTPVGLPVTFASGSGGTIAAIDTVQAVLTLQSPSMDPQTHQKPSTTLVSTVKINNCSQATTGASMSCQ